MDMASPSLYLPCLLKMSIFDLVNCLLKKYMLERWIETTPCVHIFWGGRGGEVQTPRRTMMGNHRNIQEM